MLEMVLDVDRLTCGYGNSTVLRDISFELMQAELFGVIGPNGSGKTTLLRAISGLLSFSGTIRLQGEDIRSLPRRLRAQKLAVVTPAVEAAPPLTVEDFILLGRIPHWKGFQLLETKGDIDIAEEAMATTGILHLRKKRMGNLSSGEQQLASIARALAQRPQLLLLDEPTSHLDIGHQAQVIDLLKRLKKGGLTIMIILHDLNLASLLCERLLLLHGGRVYATGTAEQVLKKDVIEDVYKTQVTVLAAPTRARPIILPISNR